MKKMLNHSLSWLLLVFILLEAVVKTQLTIYESSHGFITNNHERYLVDDISMHEEFPLEAKASAINNFNLKYYLKFEPEFLDFKQRPLGIPHLEKVTLFNINSNRSIDMTSISGSTVHFHSSFFEDKKIPPLGNTSFNVVFLGREEGSVESNLFIQTTEGHIKYQVKGASIYSPYRLRPIVGIKLPINATFSPLIYMYNPYSEPIQIIEMYGSGGDFLLELPSGELEGPKDMWKIQPMETKPVIRIRFHAKVEQNHTAFVRIRLNNTEEILVVPLEVEVSSTAGLFTPQGSVEFGVGGSFDTPKKVNLYLHNALKKVTNIHSISTTSSAITVEMVNSIVPPGTKIKDELSTVHVATLTLNWKTAFEIKDYSGKIIINYGKTKTEIPYYLTVVQGGIRYNTSSTRYYTNDKSNDMMLRDIIIKNDFLTPLKLINVSIEEEGQEFFYLNNFKPVILKVKEIQNIFTLGLKSKFNLSNLIVNSHITLMTNITEFKFPLISYNGKLKVYLPYKSKDNSLDLGLLSLDTKKDAFILVVNKNPVNININNIKTSIPSAYVDIVGCNSGDYANVLLMDTYKNMTRCEILKTGNYAILRLSVKTSKTQGQIWGDISVVTQYEQLSIPVHFKVASGKLDVAPDKLVFEQCFPGKICSHPLRVHSTFDESMIIEDVFSIPPDKRLFSKHTGHIVARSNKIIGHLYLNPQLGCSNECYNGMLNETLISWCRTLVLPKKVHESDLNLVNMFYNRYLNTSSNGLSLWQNLTVRLDTSEVKGHIFKTRVKMTWPSLLADNNENKSVYNFPLTQVGNITYINITIKNPSSHNLIVQVVMDIHYPNLNFLFEGLPPTFIPKHLDKAKPHDDRFFLNDDNKHKLNLFKTKLGLKAHKKSLPVILKPNENYTVTVGYKAADYTSDTGFIFLRNNLTVIEVISLIGKGAYPHFKFGNRKPGSSQPLAFELTEKHLKDCERDKNKKFPPPNLSVKRSFTARNTGSIVIYVNNFYINGLPCEGYGFKVLNCEPFVLLPNGTKKIDIAFTPDFTLAKIARTLILDTSLNVPVNYTLVTTVPSYYLSLCSSVLSRPQWETYLYYSAISIMCFLLGFVIVIPVMESERILKQTLGVMSKQGPATQPTLDLRLLGAQTRSEIRSHKSDDSDLKDGKKEKQNVEHKNGYRNSTNEDQKNKVDVEKYTALIPSTSKSKRKLSKRNSNEHQTEYEGQKHKVVIETQKCLKLKVESKTSIEHKSETELLQNTVKKFINSNNNNNSNNKDVKTKSPVQEKKGNDVSMNNKQLENFHEEETSSTTTESSNTEDLENKQPKIKKNKTNPVKSEATRPERQNNFVKSMVRKPIARSMPKMRESTDAKEKDDLNNRVDKIVEPKYKNKKNNRKEKQNRKSSMKSKQEALSFNPINNNPISPASPVPFRNVWSENRAKFSDVVARSDNSVPISNIKTTSQSQICKPTLCVEPIVQYNAELGPIGTRKMDYRVDSNLSNLSPSTTNQCVHPLLASRADHQNNRSFYTECHKLAVESSNAFLDMGNIENWSNNNTFNDIPLPHNRHHISQNNNALPDPWTNSTSVNNQNVHWDTLYHSNNEEILRNRSNVQSNYLWGSSPVWTPWSPEITRAPTRTPPGFDFARDVEDESRFQTASYNPFGNNSIWTQHPWNYSHGQQ